MAKLKGELAKVKGQSQSARPKATPKARTKATRAKAPRATPAASATVPLSAKLDEAKWSDEIRDAYINASKVETGIGEKRNSEKGRMFLRIGDSPRVSPDNPFANWSMPAWSDYSNASPRGRAAMLVRRAGIDGSATAPRARQFSPSEHVDMIERTVSAQFGGDYDVQVNYGSDDLMPEFIATPRSPSANLREVRGNVYVSTRKGLTPDQHVIIGQYTNRSGATMLRQGNNWVKRANQAPSLRHPGSSSRASDSDTAFWRSMEPSLRSFTEAP